MAFTKPVMKVVNSTPRSVCTCGSKNISVCSTCDHVRETQRPTTPPKLFTQHQSFSMSSAMEAATRPVSAAGSVDHEHL